MSVQRPNLTQKAEALAAELDSGDFPEDLEPQEVAWLLRELVRLVNQTEMQRAEKA